MADHMITAQALVADGNLQGAWDLLSSDLGDQAGPELARYQMALSDIALRQGQRAAAATCAFNAAAALVNAGYWGDAATWLGEHVGRMPEDTAARLLYRDVLRHLASSLRAQEPDQAEQLDQTASDLEWEQAFLRSATPQAAIAWWRAMPRDNARQAVVREVCTVLPVLESDLKWSLYSLIEAEIPKDIAGHIYCLMASAAIVSNRPDCLLHRHLVERWSQDYVRPVIEQIEPLVLRTGPMVVPARLRIGFIDVTYLCGMINYRETLILPSLRALAEGPYDIFIYIYPGSAYHQVSNFDDIIPPGITARKIDLSLSGAEIIARDNIDVLLMMNGFLDNLPIQIFAARPAKRLALWIHTFGTYGPDLFDGTLIDEYSYNHLHAAMSYEPAVGREGYMVLLGPPADAPPIRSLPAKRNGFVTFGVLARPSKFGPQSYRLWAMVLKAVPGAKLRVYGTSLLLETAEAKMIEDMKKEGISSESVELSPYFESHGEYLEDIGGVDIVLDSYPFTGGLTTFEALWQGVPVVSLKSETPIGCNGLIYLSEVGLADCVVETAQEYCDRATQLAGDFEALEKLRYGLRDRMLRSRLMDIENFRDRFRRAMQQLLALPARGA